MSTVSSEGGSKKKVLGWTVNGGERFKNYNALHPPTIHPPESVSWAASEGASKSSDCGQVLRCPRGAGK